MGRRPGDRAPTPGCRGLTILGLAAVIVVALMVFLIGTSGSDNNGLPGRRDSRAEHDPARRSTPPSLVVRGHAPSTRGTTATTCSSGPALGDAGHVIDAINNFRKSNGQSAVPRSRPSRRRPAR